MTFDAKQFSLADFYFSDSDNPLKPPVDYTQWRRDTSWATSLYEPVLCDPAAPINHLLLEGGGKQRVVNMTSYGYLGLVRHPEIVAAARDALEEYGTGACGSPILSGKTLMYKELEAGIARLTGREATLVYNSGFGGALGTAAGLMRKGDIAFVDERAHISLVDGIKIGGARLVFFAHNDAASLDQQLAQHQNDRRLVFVDGLYSMDGDMADLPALLDVCEAHGVGLVVDEAHSILCCGETGGGVVEHFGVRDRIGVQYGTFSKGFSSVGGFAAADDDLIEYLRFYANPYGFTCALPPAVVAGLCAALKVMERETWRRERLWENASYFRNKLHSLGVNTGTSNSYVVPIVVGEDRALLYELGRKMRDCGLFLTPVDYPTVPLDQARYRASITSLHSKADIDEALQIVEDIFVPAMRNKGLLRAYEC